MSKTVRKAMVLRKIKVKVLLKDGHEHTATFQGMSKGKKRLYAIQNGQSVSWGLSRIDCLFIV